MARTSDDVHAGIRSEAVKAKTGKGWAEWFAVLDAAGAAAWPHKDIAAYLHDQCGCPPWWSQMVAVGFEQARGLRVKHQVADGYSASASKTVAVPVEALYAAWVDPAARAKWLPDAAAITIRKATENKSLRITWTDGTSTVEANFYPKGPGKSQVAVQQNKLADLKAVARVKSYWTSALETLKGQLAAPAAGGAPAAATRPRRTARAMTRVTKKKK